MISSPWKAQAHLWCCYTYPPDFGIAGAELVAAGSLEDMIREAETVDPVRRRLLLLARDGDSEMLAWRQIEQLRCASTFPVEI